MDTAFIELRHMFTTPPHIHDPALGQIDMSTIWVVDSLRRAPRQTIAELADAMDVAHSTASRLVARAERAGAVARTCDPRDTRRVNVTLTDAGRDLAAQALAYRLRILSAATSDWTAQQRHTFATLLTRFNHREDPS